MSQLTRIQVGLKEYGEALKSLHAAAKVEPQNKAIRQEIAKCVIPFLNLTFT